MDVLAMIGGVVDAYGLYSRFFGGRSDTRQQLASMRRHLHKIHSILERHVEREQGEGKRNVDPYASTCFSPEFFDAATQVREVREVLADITAQGKTVVADKAQLEQCCYEAMAELTTVVAQIRERHPDSRELAQLANLLESHPAFVAQPALTRSFTHVDGGSADVPQRKTANAIAHCDCCGKSITRRTLEQNLAIVRKGGVYCMNCICEREAGPFYTTGKYRLLHKLGEGGMGDVFLAVQTQLYRLVAFKWLKRMNDPSREKIDRFRRECKLGANLQHPNIVQFYDAGIEPGKNPVYFVATEYVAGEKREPMQEKAISVTLKDILQREGIFTPQRLRPMAEKLLEAVCFMWYKGVVHRDLKPANVFVTTDGRVKLGDLGLAKFFDETELSTVATRSGMSMGTLPYMPPEQCGDAGSVDHRADIYSFGATLYELLTGDYVFAMEGNPSAVAYMSRICCEKALPPSQRVASIPPQWDRLVLKCLEKKPEDRYQTPHDILADLRAMPE